MSESVASSVPQRSPLLKHLFMVLRFAIPLAALVYLFSRVPLARVLTSMRKTQPSAVAIAVVVALISMLLATVRWRILFTACGTGAKPRFWTLFRVYWICIFYNTCLPGGVGGEVVRGLATRRAVGERGLPNALGIVLLERALGFTGMLMLVVLGFALAPLPGFSNVMLWSALGICIAIGSVVGIVSGRRIAPLLPGPLRRIAAALPTITSAPLFLVALALSLVTQFCGVVAGHAIVSCIAPKVTAMDSLVILPLVNALQYFPFSVGGLGVREGAFIKLYGFVGIAEEDALAASIVVGFIQVAVSAVGGVLHAMRPLEARDD